MMQEAELVLGRYLNFPSISWVSSMEKENPVYADGVLNLTKKGMCL
jgi:hypothetical protein